MRLTQQPRGKLGDKHTEIIACFAGDAVPKIARSAANL
jgi:hypothetical protein